MHCLRQIMPLFRLRGDQAMVFVHRWASWPAAWRDAASVPAVLIYRKQAALPSICQSKFRAGPVDAWWFRVALIQPSLLPAAARTRARPLAR